MKKSFKVLKAVLAVIGLVAIIAIISIVVLINHGKNTLTITGPAMEPTLKSGQKVHLHEYAASGIPQRGDIVEFTEHGASSGKNLVLRVVGIPGDHVTISNGQLSVSNTQNPNGFNPDLSYLSGNTTTSGERDVTLQAIQYYVLGDDRSNSLDSRVFGFILASQIIGKVTP